MKKLFIFTPLYNIEKTEKILSDYEENGLRVKKSKCRHWYYFEESKAKKCNTF